MSCHDDTSDSPLGGEEALSGVTVNPCTVCAPLGAVLVAAGVEGAMPLLHGAQGCATYIRRYLISHFREPMDVASSSFTEASAVFGGENDFTRAVDNVGRQYDPKLVAIGTTCLTETMGEDVHLMIQRYGQSRGAKLPIVYASTASYRDGHIEGFHSMVCAIIRSFATEDGGALQGEAEAHDLRKDPFVNVLPPLISPAELRHLREIVEAFGLRAVMLPDYSERLDAPIQDHYCAMPEGGTKLSDIARMKQARATIDFTLPGTNPRASDLLGREGAPATVLGLPIGVEATDAFISALAAVSGRETPEWLDKERGRLLDAYADCHKYVFGKRVAVYGDPEFVAAVARFLLEVGARPVLCATGARNRALDTEELRSALGEGAEVLSDTDFATIEARAKKLGVELLIGSSKGYRVARALGVPLIRLGFPIHDRVGAGRMQSLGYRGTAALLDTLVNTLLHETQERSTVGFAYL